MAEIEVVYASCKWRVGCGWSVAWLVMGWLVMRLDDGLVKLLLVGWLVGLLVGYVVG